MVVKSGKGINQLGLFEGWNEEKNLDYVLLSVKNLKTLFRVLTIGVWAPKKCNKEEYYNCL